LEDFTMQRLITIAAAVLGAAIAGSNFFTDFTNHTNWRSFGQYAIITRYDAAFYSGIGAFIGGSIGLSLELALTRYTLHRNANRLRRELLQMRDLPGMTPEQQQAIDLTLAGLQENKVKVTQS
jgi:hypothetical protein